MNEIPSSVLVVDDEVQIRRFLRTGFELDGFTVREAETGAEALRAATLSPSDLVILDLGLPDMDGADVLERLRAWSTVPLIVLSVRANEAEKVRLLELGADDYVVKPFGMAELLARAHSAMRRQLRAARSEPVVKFGPLAIDFAARAVFINDQRVTLTPKEYRLLQILAQHSRQRRHPPAPAARGLGQRAYRRHPLSAHFRAQAAAQDRGRPDAAAHPRHRARRRLSAGCPIRSRARLPRRRPRPDAPRPGGARAGPIALKRLKYCGSP
jgi:two-component system KDP operon response regulator KdpE